MNASQVPVRAGLDCDVTVTVDLTDETLAYRNILNGIRKTKFRRGL